MHCDQMNSVNLREHYDEIYSLDTITINHFRKAIYSVENYPDVQLCDVNSDGKFKFYSISGLSTPSISDPNAAKVIPAEHQIESIISEIVQDTVVELRWETGVVCYYDYSGVQRLKELLQCKIVKDSMVNGRDFLFSFVADDAETYVAEINKKSLQAFWNLLSEQEPNSVLTLNNKLISSNSLCSLMSSSSYLSEDCLDQIAYILNENANYHQTFVVNFKDVKENLKEFISKIKHSFGTDLSDVNIVVYGSTDGENGETYAGKHMPSSTFSNYVFAIYSPRENKVLYVDTFAKPIPKCLHSFLVKLSKELGNGILYFGMYFEESAFVGQSENAWNNLLLHHGCETVGGLSVIIGMSMFTLDRKMFQILSGQEVCGEYEKSLWHLKNISDSSQFLRLVLIDWIIQGEVNLSQIYKRGVQDKEICNVKLKMDNRLSSLVYSPSLIKVKSSAKDIQPTSKRVLDVHTSRDSNINFDKDSSSFPKSIIQTRKIMAGKKLARDDNDDMKQNPGFLRVKAGQKQFSISYKEVNHLLFGSPCIRFENKEMSYYIECNLASGGRKYKFFKCSPHLGRNDREVISQIQDFFVPANFQHWLETEAATNCTVVEDMQVNSGAIYEFEPELIIVLNESASYSVEKIEVETCRTSVSRKVNLKTAADKMEDPLTDNSYTVDSSLCNKNNKDIGGSSGSDFSSANTVKVGCRLGRIPIYFGEIQDMIIGRPVIAFRKKKCCYSFECTLYTGHTAYKNFVCHKDKGRDDLSALKQIQEFLKPKNFTPWMKENLKLKQRNKRKKSSEDSFSLKNNKRMFEKDLHQCELQEVGRDIVVLENEDISKEISEETSHICMEISDNGAVNKCVTSIESAPQVELNPASLSYEKIKDYIVGKPKVHYRKAKNLYKLECMLWDGSKVHRNFPCSPVEREKTVLDIQKFLQSDKAVNWVQNCDDSWIFQYEVKAGVDTRLCLDKIPFDLTKHFIYDRNTVKPEYSKETCWVSVTENRKWGKTHRYDETYRIVKSTSALDPNTVVAYVYLNCASKTNECRSACGALLHSLTVFGGACDNCGLSLDSGRQCYNCKTVTSSQWYKKGEPGELCASCYTYRQRKGCRRPTEHKTSRNRNVNTVHHNHLKCNWKMKLEMKLNNLNTWNVYESSENVNCHLSTPVQENKKPALGIRDMWDKLRVSKKATSLQIHSIESKCKPKGGFEHDNSGQYAHTLSQVKARCELVDKHHSVKNSMSETYQIALNKSQIPSDPVVPVTEKNVKAERQLTLDECDGNHTRICGICFERGINPPFTCVTKRDLDAHKNKMHNSCGDLCALCYKEIGMIVKFEDSRELLQHLNKHKSK